MILKDVRIRICNDTDTNDRFITELSSMINQVYLVAEAEIWKKNHQRISAGHLADLINKGEMMVAEVNNEIAACVQIELLGKGVAKFGMLTVAPAYKGKKLGSIMVQEAERHAVTMGRVKMRLELLTPKNIANPGKEFLLNWYTRIGYQFLKQVPFEAITPGEKDNLRISCFFKLYEKALVLTDKPSRY